MSAALELMLEAHGETLRLFSPGVGIFTEALATGALVAPGARVGTLVCLGRPAALVAPASALGRVVSARRERVWAPVGFRDVLYELAPLAAGAPPETRSGPAEREADFVFRSPQSGRFYHRPSPDERPFLERSGTLVEGQPVGLIEVMKTFALVTYQTAVGLPRAARFAGYLVPDGGEVAQGAPLFELEAGA